MVVHNILPLRQQHAPSWHRNFLRTFCPCLDEVFHSQKYFNLNQSRKTAHFQRWRLTNLCCFPLEWFFRKRNWKWPFVWLNQPMGSWHEYSINRIFFAFSGTDSGVADWSLWGKICSTRDRISFWGFRLFFGETIYPKTSVYHNFWSSVPRKNFQNLAACFGLETFVSTFTFLLQYMNLDTLLS